MDSDEEICADRLTTFEIAPDGSRFCMNVADQSGNIRGVSLPSDCLIQLIMTLPEMAVRALKAQHGEESIRIVYPLGSLVFEAGRDATILTLATEDGFSVSFGFTADDLKYLEKAVRDARARLKPAVIRH